MIAYGDSITTNDFSHPPPWLLVMKLEDGICALHGVSSSL